MVAQLGQAAQGEERVGFVCVCCFVFCLCRSGPDRSSRLTGRRMSGCGIGLRAPGFVSSRLVSPRVSRRPRPVGSCLSINRGVSQSGMQLGTQSGLLVRRNVRCGYGYG